MKIAKLITAVILGIAMISVSANAKDHSVRALSDAEMSGTQGAGCLQRCQSAGSGTCPAVYNCRVNTGALSCIFTLTKTGCNGTTSYKQCELGGLYCSSNATGTPCGNTVTTVCMWMGSTCDNSDTVGTACSTKDCN